MSRTIAIIAGIAVISLSSMADTDKTLFCSDASGDLRMAKTDINGDEEFYWIWQGQKYDDKNVDVELNKRNPFSGDKYNGHFFATANFSLKGTPDSSDEDRPMLCHNTNNKREAKKSAIEIETDFRNMPLSPGLACSSVTGRIQKLSHATENKWVTNNWLKDGTSTVEEFPASHIAQFNNHFHVDRFESNSVYQVQLVAPDGTATFPELVICE